MFKLENMLAMSGVQQMLGNLLKSAAPEIAQQVDQIANVAIDLKAQVDRIEASLKRIETHLGISGEQHGDPRRTASGLAVTHDKTGNGACQQTDGG
jgi:hypothetical protein